MTADSILHRARRTLERDLLLDPALQVHPQAGAGPENILGVGIGEKIRRGEGTGRLSVKVYVQEKLAPDQVAPGFQIPRRWKGALTDVEQVGTVVALGACTDSRRTRQRPLMAGISVSFHADDRPSAGTLGAFVRNAKDRNSLLLLSNNHVLADSNGLPAGTAIVQPGSLDGGRLRRDRVGALAHFVPLGFGSRANLVDCAVARLDSRVKASPEICGVGAVPGHAAPRRNMRVAKHGRTTGFTEGVISDVHVTIKVSYGNAGTALFRDQVAIRGRGEPFSAAGDSGSLIVTAGSHRACALLFAGAQAENLTFANKIGHVLRALKISLATGRKVR